MSFWQLLEKPIIGLSPMDGVTDHPFRHITKRYGAPSVIYTEFTSVEGVCHGATRLLEDFLYDETQRPIIGQIYGTTPDSFRQTAIALCQLGFDGIDINMGCPAKNVAHSGAGAALIRTPKLAQQIIAAVQKGIKEWQEGSTVLDCPNLSEQIRTEVLLRKEKLPLTFQESRAVPVSVKTRIGYDSIAVKEWIPNLLEMGLAAIAIHGRTLKQQYSGSANWEAIGQAVQILNQLSASNSTVYPSPSTLILGNGDVISRKDALEKIEKYQLDGVLLGRATMGNPFVFTEELSSSDDVLKRFKVAYEHALLFENTYSHHEHYNFLPMRKHLGWYVRDVSNASLIRQEIYQTHTAQEFKEVMEKYGFAV